MHGYVAPELHGRSFTCPYCGVLAQQNRAALLIETAGGSRRTHEPFWRADCTLCQETSVWFRKTMIFPLTGTAPMPNADLPDDIKRDYLEARAIAALSPRGAAALLRLAIQKLCKELGERGVNIDDDIASLVAKRLDSEVQKALDILRVVGNESVHPGTLDVRDDPELAAALFERVNEIGSEMISKPKRYATLYSRLPEAKRAAITARNAKALATNRVN